MKAISVESNVPAGTGETASTVRSSPKMTQGCRPVSARYQPPSVATMPEGAMMTSERRNQRVVKRPPCQQPERSDSHAEHQDRDAVHDPKAVEDHTHYRLAVARRTLKPSTRP